MPRSERFGNFLHSQPQAPFPGGGRAAILIDENECERRVRAELVELRASERFPLHVHPKSDHVIIVVSGKGILLWQDQEREIVAGDTFVVPMGEIHSIGAASDEGLRLVVINVPPVAFDHEDFMHSVHHSGKDR